MRTLAMSVLLLVAIAGPGALGQQAHLRLSNSALSADEVQLSQKEKKDKKKEKDKGKGKEGDKKGGEEQEEELFPSGYEQFFA